MERAFMPWVIGIDEAGYGPNLGPLVMTSVAVRLPQELAGADLWRVLRTTVRKRPSATNHRLLIQDSKIVYSPTRGLLDLETGVLATLSPWCIERPASLAEFLAWLCPSNDHDVTLESWYTGSSLLPVSADQTELAAVAGRFARCCTKNQVSWGPVHSVIICPTRFNDLVDHWRSKGAVLGQALATLLLRNQALEPENESLIFFVDKHGGRNNYAAMLQNAFADAMVIAREEGLARSVYDVVGLNRDIQLTIQPRADGKYFCVALASMVSKYVRELLMREFNEFWQSHVPGLEATAGYPGDAARFYEEIRPAVSRLGIPEYAVWRRR
jgi:ribonuclease HII